MQEKYGIIADAVHAINGGKKYSIFGFIEKFDTKLLRQKLCDKEEKTQQAELSVINTST